MYLATPAGGFKVVYEYANRLQERGHRVTLVHPRNEEAQNGAIELVKSQLWKYKLQLKQGPSIPWFDFHPEVRVLLVPDLREQFIPDADAIVATAFSTAFHVAGYRPRKGRKFYLIQGYETWQGPEERIKASWRLPLKKIVISRWLQNLVEGTTSRAHQVTHIPVGFDFSHFKVTAPIRERVAPRVGMLAAANRVKGTVDGLAALRLTKEQLPDLEAVLFGTEQRDSELPNWIEYVRLPSPDELLDLYNSCQVFLHPSWTEGWGLPASEAMACGCALVATAHDGVKEFAVDGENALLAPVKQPEKLAQRLIEALSNDELRVMMAEAGHQQIQQFDWDRAVDAMERLLESRKV